MLFLLFPPPLLLFRFIVSSSQTLFVFFFSFAMMRKVTSLDWILEHGKMMMMMSKRNSNQSRAKTYLRFEKQNSLLLAKVSSSTTKMLLLLRALCLLEVLNVFFGRSVSHVCSTTRHRFERTKGVFEDFCVRFFVYLSLICSAFFVVRMVKSQSALCDFAALHSLWRKFFGTIPSTSYVIVLTTFLYTTST